MKLPRAGWGEDALAWAAAESQTAPAMARPKPPTVRAEMRSLR